MTSQFDIHATLWHILHGNMKLYNNDGFRKGVSLFMQLRKNRTCNEAGIPPLYCPYIDWTANQISPRQLTILALKFVKFLNKLQRKYFLKFGVEIAPCERKTLLRAENGGILERGRFYLLLFTGPGPLGSEYEVSGTYKGNFSDVQFLVSIDLYYCYLSYGLRELD